MTTAPVDRPPTDLLAFGEAELVGVRFVGGAYAGADLIELRTRGVVFEDCDFSHARLSSSEHVGTAFLRCTFRDAVLRDALFDGCKLSGRERMSTSRRAGCSRSRSASWWTSTDKNPL